MEKPKEAATTPAPQPEFRKATEHFSMYSNSANVTVTTWDFSFIFGEIVGLTEDKKSQIIEEKATIKMSPQHAKALLNVLSDNMKQYEEMFGEVRWQPKAGEVKEKI